MHTGRVDCAAPRHDSEPVSAESCAYLCKPCRLGLSRDLHRLPALDRDLEQLLDPRKGASPVRGGGGGLPYHEPAAECRSQIRHDLAWWTARIADERGFDPPVTTEPRDCGPVELAAMAGWITGQLRWCTFRPWAGDLAAAMAGDRGRAMALIDPMPRAEIPIPPEYSWCPSCRETGALYATIYQADGDRRPSMVTCGSCLAEWDTVQWMRLGRTILTWASAA